MADGCAVCRAVVRFLFYGEYEGINAVAAADGKKAVVYCVRSYGDSREVFAAPSLGLVLIHCYLIGERVGGIDCERKSNNTVAAEVVFECQRIIVCFGQFVEVVIAVCVALADSCAVCCAVVRFLLYGEREGIDAVAAVNGN